MITLLEIPNIYTPVTYITAAAVNSVLEFTAIIGTHPKLVFEYINLNGTNDQSIFSPAFNSSTESTYYKAGKKYGFGALSYLNKVKYCYGLSNAWSTDSQININTSSPLYISFGDMLLIGTSEADYAVQYIVDSYDFTTWKDYHLRIPGSGAANASLVSYGRIKLYNNDELVHDLIPCYINRGLAKGDIGVYDLVTEAFFLALGLWNVSEDMVLYEDTYEELPNKLNLVHVKLNTFETEELTSEEFEVLKKLAKLKDEVGDPTRVNIEGKIHIPIAYGDTKELLMSKFPNFTILMDKSAIRFEDSNVERICILNFDFNRDGYMSEDETPRYVILGSAFVNLPLLRKFNELRYFTNLEDLGEGFNGCSELREVTLPDSVTELKTNIFKDCTNLITINNAEAITTIRTGAFYGCNSLTELNFPNVTTLDSGAFWLWKDTRNSGILKRNIYLPKVSSWKGYPGNIIPGESNYGTIYLPLVTNLPSNAFWLVGTDDLYLGNLTEVSNNAFNGIITKRLHIPSIECLFTMNISTTNRNSPGSESGAELYVNEDKVTDILVPNTCSELKTGCLLGYSFNSIRIPSSVLVINNYNAFATNLYLESITPWISTDYGKQMCNNLYLNNTLVTNLIIPASVTKIGNYAFNINKNIQSITFLGDSSNIDFGKCAFADCTNLVIDTLTCKLSKTLLKAFNNVNINNLILLDLRNTAGLDGLSDIFNLHLKTVDLSAVDFSTFTNMNEMFIRCYDILEIDLHNKDLNNITTFNSTFSNCLKLKTLNLGNNTLSNSTYCANFISNCPNLETLILPNLTLNTYAVSMQRFLSGCAKLSNFDFSNWNISKVNNLDESFSGCANLVNINIGTGTSIATIIANICRNCILLESFKGIIDTVNVTNANNAFYNCPNLVNIDNIENWNVRNITNMEGMFNSCAINYNFSDWNFDSVTTLNSTWCSTSNISSISIKSVLNNIACSFAQSFKSSKITSIDLSNFKRPISSFSSTFNITSRLSTIIFPTINNFSGPIDNIFSLSNIEEVDMSSISGTITNALNAFLACPQLIEVNISNLSNTATTNINCLFKGCPKLKKVYLNKMQPVNSNIMHNLLFSDTSSEVEIWCTLTFKNWLITEANTVGLPTPLRDSSSPLWHIVTE